MPTLAVDLEMDNSGKAFCNFTSNVILYSFSYTILLKKFSINQYFQSSPVEEILCFKVCLLAVKFQKVQSPFSQNKVTD